MFKRLPQFALIGAVATLIQYLILIAAVRGAGVQPALASGIGFIISACVNYFCNYHFTFRSNQRHRVAATRFTVLAAVGLLINSAIMQALLAAGLYYVIAQISATAVVLLWNFIGNSLWTFGGNSNGAQTAALQPAAPGNVIARNVDLIAIVALTVVIRVLVCLASDNEAGDADDRVIIAAEWALAPYLIRGGPWLPLHFYATGLLTWVFSNPIVAGKVLSLVTGALTVIPLFYLTQRLFNRSTAVIAGLLFAIYGTQVGLSSVVMSEAPFAFFSVWALSVFFRERHSEHLRLRGFLLAALLLAIAGGFRQEAWQLTGILTLYLFWLRRTRRFAIPFAILGFSTFALWDIANVTAGAGWLQAIFAVGNAKAAEAAHHQFSAVENVLRWAWIFVRSPGVLVSALAITGLILALRRRLSGELGLVAVLLIAPYMILSVVRPQWQPQMRYSLIFGILVLPYAAGAAIAIFQSRYDMRWVTAVILAVSFVSQGLYYHQRSRLFLPVEDYNPSDVAAWQWLGSHAALTSAVVIEDVDWRSPGLIAHSGLYSLSNHIIPGFDGPQTLEKLVGSEPHPMLVVLHSPRSKWQFLERFNPQLMFRNPDYEVLRLE